MDGATGLKISPQWCYLHNLCVMSCEMYTCTRSLPWQTYFCSVYAVTFLACKFSVDQGQCPCIRYSSHVICICDVKV